MEFDNICGIIKFHNNLRLRTKCLSSYRPHEMGWQVRHSSKPSTAMFTMKTSLEILGLLLCSFIDKVTMTREFPNSETISRHAKGNILKAVASPEYMWAFSTVVFVVWLFLVRKKHLKKSMYGKMNKKLADCLWTKTGSFS